MSRAAELLTDYLRQRCELGETELVLEELDRDELLRLLRGRAGEPEAVGAAVVRAHDRAGPVDDAFPLA